ncbi:hypothetical protein TIFTF001_015612 [Ficus carica]|uniref:Uncharacterized protein n=1 Tax=Ficus carica TaxID=3494 RepID=A0AA88ASJ3_FICCA|nr:hypothetical protein TIFTF001_015612 [Ficus carica]
MGRKIVVGKLTLMAHGKSRSAPRDGEIASEISTRSCRRRARSSAVFSMSSKPSSPVSCFPRAEHAIFSDNGHLCSGFGGLGIWI